MTLKFSLAAQDDLVSIHQYVEDESGASRADALIRRIIAKCEILIDQPRIGRRRPELDLNASETRSMNEAPYTVLYTIADDVVWVIRVLHGARDMGPWAMTEWSEPN